MPERWSLSEYYENVKFFEFEADGLVMQELE